MAIVSVVSLVLIGVGARGGTLSDRTTVTSGLLRGTTAAVSPLPPSPAVTLPGATLTARPRTLAPPLPSARSTSRPPRSTPPTPPAIAPTPRAASGPAPLPLPTVEVVVSSFNVLGASHTTDTGKRPGMASGRVRAGRAAALLRRHGADVVGFQELQRPQLAALQRQTGMDFYPGLVTPERDPENSIGWRRDRWTAVEKRTVDIPYFNGSRRAMPFVRLRSVTTGLEAWFANFHNPADTSRFPRQQRYRDLATDIQAVLVNQLLTTTGLPVFVTGDMNEREEYFCRFTGRTPMVAARGGSNDGRCEAARPRAVDWIFASPDVTFTDYVEDRSRLVDITTDHPVIVARARITGAPTSVAHGD